MTALTHGYILNHSTKSETHVSCLAVILTRILNFYSADHPLDGCACAECEDTVGDGLWMLDGDWTLPDPDVRSFDRL